MQPSTRLRLLSLAIAAVPGAAAGSAAQRTSAITVTVYAAETQAPLAGAQLSVDGHPRGVADARGVVRVEGLEGGAHGLGVSLIGRIPHGLRLELTAGEEREVVVLLRPLSVGLAPLTASARERSRDRRVEGFYRRAQDHTTGHFVTRAQIEERNIRLFSDIFRGLPGVRVDPGPGGMVINNPRAHSLIDGDGDCPPRYFVDGFPYVPSGPVDTEFSANDVEGIEVYFGNVPPQWNGSRALCGVILIWTRTSAAPASGSH
ncbi:MAG: TonB-dependent receptor plug domain-containing protein [Longimicrobiaceae bacterium]